jgi:aldose 1-epimerase
MKVTGLLLLGTLSAAAQYAVHQEGDVFRLEDGGSQTVVWVMPSRGSSAFNMTVKGKKVLYFPFATAQEYKTGRGMSGIPFLAPWANRLDEPAFYANGKKYSLNLELGNVRSDAGNHPIHGFLTTASQWEVAEAKADANSAWIASRLEFYRQPEWMAQFPFAHTIEMTYRLQNGALEVLTKLHNLSAEPMPVAIGFHPYFQVNDAPREEWTFGIAARTEWVLSQDLIPTGETRPIEQFLPHPQHAALKGLSLDHVFGDLIRDASGKATMWVQGKSEKIEVSLGRNYRAVVVYSPGGPGRDFICFEPMTGISDALNLAHRGVYKELQSIPPGQTWQESFWVQPSGW